MQRSSVILSDKDTEAARMRQKELLDSVWNNCCTYMRTLAQFRTSSLINYVRQTKDHYHCLLLMNFVFVFTNWCFCFQKSTTHWMSRFGLKRVRPVSSIFVLCECFLQHPITSFDFLLYKFQKIYGNNTFVLHSKMQSVIMNLLHVLLIAFVA